jgi:succinyl-diaminopimelate desuccinylase
MPDPHIPVDPVELTASLIRCQSVTPEDGGAIPLLAGLLSSAGFVCNRCDRGGIANLHARWGTSGPVIGFNGHTDVVPVGDAAAWSVDPFGAEVRDDHIYGRGACDMKSGVAAFIAAAIDAAAAGPAGSIVVTVTGDEEGVSTDGTPAILDWMDAGGETMDACIVGEPTCPDRLGDMVKIGRRGAMTVSIAVTGVQGHTAYPHRATNPLPALVRLLDMLASHRLDEGTAQFDPSTLAITTIDTGNPAANVIPATSRATVNLRFNDVWTSQTLTAWLRGEGDCVAAAYGVTVEMSVRVSGESFLTPPGPLSTLVCAAVEAETGIAPALSTTGGTSDARFIRAHCPVVEFGLVGRTMHQIDERAVIADIVALKAIYRRIIDAFLA